jgi:hypothetical protein
MFQSRFFRSFRVVLSIVVITVVASSHAQAGWGTVAICRCGHGFWSACGSYPSPAAAESAIQDYFRQHGHSCRILETTNSRYLVVVFTQGRRGIGWFASDDESEALDRAISDYRRSIGRPHQFYIFDNERGGEVVKGVID